MKLNHVGKVASSSNAMIVEVSSTGLEIICWKLIFMGDRVSCGAIRAFIIWKELKEPWVTMHMSEIHFCRQKGMLATGAPMGPLGEHLVNLSLTRKMYFVC